MKQIKIIVEKHADGYIAYPLGLKGVVVAEGETYEQAFAEVKSAIQFHIKTFGAEAFHRSLVGRLQIPTLPPMSIGAGIQHFRHRRICLSTLVHKYTNVYPTHP